MTERQLHIGRIAVVVANFSMLIAYLLTNGQPAWAFLCAFALIVIGAVAVSRRWT